MKPTYKVFCTESAMSQIHATDDPMDASKAVEYAMMMASEGYQGNERVVIFDGIGIYYNQSKELIVLITYEDGYPLFNEENLAKTKLLPMPFYLA